MIKIVSSFRRIGLKVAVLAVLALPSLANAQQYFTDTLFGDVNIGFRKTGTFQEAYELVVYAGNITNYVAMPIGTSTNITFYTNALATMCPDGYGNLQWSVSAAFTGTGGPWKTAEYTWPVNTGWYTEPRVNGVENSPIGRNSYTDGGTLEDGVELVSGGANQISKGVNSGNTNANNYSLLVLEPQGYNTVDMLTAAIGDSANSALGDFKAFPFSVEFVTSNSFTSPAVSDFFVNVPLSNGRSAVVDPITGLTTGNADYLGYFTLNPNGTLTFTRAAAVAPPPTVSSVSASVTNGFGPLTVVFSDTTGGGSGTNWIWNFGNGVIITNTTGASVTNTYATSGSYTVMLTVNGPGGSGSETVANFIVASPTPKISLRSTAGAVVFSGVNCPAGVQFRILKSTSLSTPLSSWKPVYTNTFASNGTFTYTSPDGSGNAFFIMVSP